jgi:hypothetical protein
MKELLLLIAKALVDNPEEVSVNEVEGEQSIILELKVARDDMGKVSESRANCKSNQNSYKICRVKENKRVVVEIIQ